MAIRLRMVDGVLVALCARETDLQDGDIYLDDSAHYALAAKFADDYQGQTMDIQYPDYWALMQTQKVRDAEISITVWLEDLADYRRC